MERSRAEWLRGERERRTLRFDEQYRISHYEKETIFPNVSRLEVEMGTNGLHAYQQTNENTGCKNGWCCCMLWCWPFGLLYLITECVANKKFHCCGSHDVIHVADSDVIVRKDVNYKLCAKKPTGLNPVTGAPTAMTLFCD